MSQPISGVSAPPQGSEREATFGMSAIFLLMLANALSMADRQILGILAEPIKLELKISDQQLGLLIGLSFSLFYATFGILMARILERNNRSKVMAICLFGWSVCTALCGLARSFTALLAMRVGVAMGEASCLPAAQSMIADYVPINRRAFAMSVAVAGSPLGVLFGLALGGIISQQFGWRAAFFVAAAPGILVAALIWMLVPDPLRKQIDGAKKDHISFIQGMRELRAIPSYWLIITGAGFVAFGIYSQSSFLSSFYLRNHAGELSASAGALGPTGFLGLMLGLILGLGGAIGTLCGGKIADHFCKGDLRKYMVMLSIVSILALPFFFYAMFAKTFFASVVLLIPSTVISFAYSGTAYAAAASLAPSHVRATASALTLLFVNLIGLGLGPITMGTLSDYFAASIGSAEGLRWALALSPVAGIVAAILFELARRSMPRDHEALSDLCGSPGRT